MKIEFIANHSWAQCGTSHKSKKGEVMEVSDGLAEILIRVKAAKKSTGKKKATK